MQESVWAWSTSCGVIVYCYFYMFRLISKENLLFAVMFLFNHVDFIRYVTRITYEIDDSKYKYTNTLLFCKSFPLPPFFFFFSIDYMIFQTFTVTFEPIRFYFLVFLFHTS